MLTIPCHSGNHWRTTKDQRHAIEAGHSLEWLLYHSLQDRYEGNKRVHLTVSESYHSYQTVYEWTVRFHHGHSMNYGGGVGGIAIPIRKAIAQWNTLRPASFDCFGSLIGDKIAFLDDPPLGRRQDVLDERQGRAGGDALCHQIESPCERIATQAQFTYRGRHTVDRKNAALNEVDRSTERKKHNRVVVVQHRDRLPDGP
jgi:hypothetical protein